MIICRLPSLAHDIYATVLLKDDRTLTFCNFKMLQKFSKINFKFPKNLKFKSSLKKENVLSTYQGSYAAACTH